jgi:hypothetical protein
MRQAVRLKPVLLTGAGVSALLWLYSKENREKAKETLSTWKQKWMGTETVKTLDSFPIEKAGHPDPYDIEDNNMVSEGAMYAVQYYNEEKEKR